MDYNGLYYSPCCDWCVVVVKCSCGRSVPCATVIIIQLLKLKFLILKVQCNHTAMIGWQAEYPSHFGWRDDVRFRFNGFRTPRKWERGIWEWGNLGEMAICYGLVMQYLLAKCRITVGRFIWGSICFPLVGCMVWLSGGIPRVYSIHFHGSANTVDCDVLIKCYHSLQFSEKLSAESH